jgi:hypothetical protein
VDVRIEIPQRGSFRPEIGNGENRRDFAELPVLENVSSGGESDDDVSGAPNRFAKLLIALGCLFGKKHVDSDDDRPVVFQPFDDFRVVFALEFLPSSKPSVIRKGPVVDFDHRYRGVRTRFGIPLQQHVSDSEIGACEKRMERIDVRRYLGCGSNETEDSQGNRERGEYLVNQ